MAAYYNEIDPFAAAWLRELINAGHIAPGEVDERSIEDVYPSDLRGFTQCHFFAGIGVWSHALRSAGWPDDRPVWTASCPCQPFSAAGKGGGFTDERHLWPALFHIFSQLRPVVVFGEQVASKDGLAWLDLVQDDLEGAGYSVGTVDLCAAGLGAPMLRQRLYWVADDPLRRKPGRVRECRPTGWSEGAVGGCNTTNDVADTQSPGRSFFNPENFGKAHAPVDAFANPSDSELYRKQRPTSATPRPTNGQWGAADWLFCRDGKWRAVEPGTFPLAHGATNRVGRLRGYGNAIVAPQATEIVEAYLNGY